MEKKNEIEISFNNELHLKDLPNSYQSLKFEIQNKYKNNPKNYHLACYNLSILFEIKNEEDFKSWKQFSNIFGKKLLIISNQNLNNNIEKEYKNININKKITKEDLNGDIISLIKIKKDIIKDIDYCNKLKQDIKISYENLKIDIQDLSKKNDELSKKNDELSKKNDE